MGDRPFGDEAYELLADFEGAESADADVEFVRQQRRLRGAPSMSRKEAVWRANQHLPAEKLTTSPTPLRRSPTAHRISGSCAITTRLPRRLC